MGGERTTDPNWIWDDKQLLNAEDTGATYFIYVSEDLNLYQSKNFSVGQYDKLLP